jgi:hypothetical protein
VPSATGIYSACDRIVNYVFVWFDFTALFHFSLFSFCNTVVTFQVRLNMIPCNCVVLLYYFGGFSNK